MDDKQGKILIYELPKKGDKVEVLLSGDNIWMTQAGLADLYQTSPQNITTHIKNIYADGECEKGATCKSDLQVQIEAGRKVKRHVLYYDLDVIIAVGFRAKSSVGNTFRKWANGVLHSYMVKGFALDDERLADPARFGKDYFDELLFRIRAIRASEKRFYQAIRDIYATSVDYDPNNEKTLEFYKSVQNKMHYAVSGHTAAEIVYSRSDASKDNMGLTSWAGERVQKDDVTIAKNYLSKEEIDSLNKIVSMYLDHAEEMAKEHFPMHMSDWKDALDEFLRFERKDILEGPGKISAKLAEQKALKEYDKFDAARILEEMPLPKISKDKPSHGPR
jgi:hypothetical protein